MLEESQLEDVPDELVLDRELVIVYVTIPVDEVELELDSDEAGLLTVNWVEDELYTDSDVDDNVDDSEIPDAVMYELVALDVELVMPVDDIVL